MNKYITTAALALTATIALVGCGTGKASTPSTTTATYRSTTTTQKYDNAMTAYLRSMQSRFPGKSDAQLISLGEQACKVIDAYGSITSAMVGIAKDPSWSVSAAGDAAYVFGTSVPTFCPRYLPELIRITQ